MATKGERQALLFLAAVALLGAGTRACRARAVSVPTTDLDHQIAAVQETGRHPSGGRRQGRERGVRPTGKGTDSAHRAPSAGRDIPAAARVDLDAATAADIERLPGVGPALAKRIVANRDTAGPFGCPAALDLVKGVGRSLLRRLDSLVTFSGAPRPACTQR